MPVKIEELISIIESIAPPSLAYEWDNTGMQLKCSEEINSVLISLDVTSATVEEAKAKGCDMIISHHPLIFEPIKHLSCGNAADVVMMQLIKYGISLYSAHTSYDRAQGGMGDTLASRLGLENICAEPCGGENLLRTGVLKRPLSRNDFLAYIKKALEAKSLRVSNTNIDTIKKVAVTGGSGGSFSKAAKEAGAQALITGEAKYHHFIEAAAYGVLLVEAGHFETERYFIQEVFISLLSRANALQLDVEFHKTDNVQPLYEYI